MSRRHIDMQVVEEGPVGVAPADDAVRVGQEVECTQKAYDRIAQRVHAHVAEERLVELFALKDQEAEYVEDEAERTGHDQRIEVENVLRPCLADLIAEHVYGPEEDGRHHVGHIFGSIHH